jgi:transposase
MMGRGCQRPATSHSRAPIAIRIKKGDDIELIAPHRTSRTPENITQDGRPLRRYKRRWTVERTIAWFQNFRRLCIRYEKSAMLFQGFLRLGCSIILLKQVYG